MSRIIDQVLKNKPDDSDRDFGLPAQARKGDPNACALIARLVYDKLDSFADPEERRQAEFEIAYYQRRALYLKK